MTTDHLELMERLPPQNLATIINLLAKNTLSSKTAKKAGQIAYKERSQDILALIDKHQLNQILDENVIRNYVQEVLDQNPDKVEAYKQGKTKLFGFFVGQVMKNSGGKLAPEIIQRMLVDRLK